LLQAIIPVFPLRLLLTPFFRLSPFSHRFSSQGFPLEFRRNCFLSMSASAASAHGSLFSISHASRGMTLKRVFPPPLQFFDFFPICLFSFLKVSPLPFSRRPFLIKRLSWGLKALLLLWFAFSGLLRLASPFFYHEFRPSIIRAVRSPRGSPVCIQFNLSIRAFGLTK